MTARGAPGRVGDQHVAHRHAVAGGERDQLGRAAARAAIGVNLLKTGSTSTGSTNESSTTSAGRAGRAERPPPARREPGDGVEAEQRDRADHRADRVRLEQVDRPAAPALGGRCRSGTRTVCRQAANGRVSRSATSTTTQPAEHGLGDPVVAERAAGQPTSRRPSGVSPSTSATTRPIASARVASRGAARRGTPGPGRPGRRAASRSAASWSARGAGGRLHGTSRTATTSRATTSAARVSTAQPRGVTSTPRRRTCGCGVVPVSCRRSSRRERPSYGPPRRARRGVCPGPTRPAWSNRQPRTSLARRACSGGAAAVRRPGGGWTGPGGSRGPAPPPRSRSG